MLGKRIMCLLGSINFMFIPFNANTLTPFKSAMQITETQVDNNEVVQKLGIYKHPFLTKLEKDKEEFEKKKAEEEAKKQKELDQQNRTELEWQTFIVSFYTGLDEENYNGCGGRNCLNQPLERGMIANNSLSIGTKIFLDNDYGIRTVADKGSSRFNAENRIDLYVAQLDGETKEQWKRRTSSYGIRYIRGYIIK